MTIGCMFRRLETKTKNETVKTAKKFMWCCMVALVPNSYGGSFRRKEKARCTFAVRQPTWRFWGEEKEEGAIYNVYLKKVRYFNPNKCVSNDSDDEISHLEWETVRVRVIKAGTLEKLMDCMINENGELDSSFVNVFLATYRSFATPLQVLGIVLDRYRRIGEDEEMKLVTKNELKKTLRMVLSVWLESYPEDFREPDEYPCLTKLQEFAASHMADSELEVRARHKLERYRRENEIKDTVTFGNGCVDNSVLYKSPVIAGEDHLKPYSFLTIPNRLFAEQLTRMDSELFKKLVPHHCLGSAWSRRDRNKTGGESPSVIATVDQFNAVSFRVISTILTSPDAKMSTRAKIIETWIDHAQELRLLKNFSSLKAIISGLQSTPIYRLRKIWQVVPREKVELFDELARIFSEENNQMTCRELLMKEGTAKVAETVGENDRHLQKAIQRQISNSQMTMQGTVPYLGTFLTDLTMLDTAISDTVGGLINFDKRRKEFEVLAQLKMLQSAANSYSILPDAKFQRWFDSVPVLDDKDSYELSLQVEPQGTSGNVKEKRNGWKPHGLGHRKNDSSASTSSSSSGQFYDQSDASMSSSPNDVVPLERKMSTSSSSSSLPSLDASISSAGSVNPASPLKQADFHVIKVTVDDGTIQESSECCTGVNLYKSIMVSSNERTPVVIKNAMIKHSLEGNSDEFCLAQMLPDGELILPPHANVYYAINTEFELKFVLRRKTDNDKPGLRKFKVPRSRRKISAPI